MSQDKGLNLELRGMRYAWKNGYFVRQRVPVLSEENENITDLDIIGIKFDNSFLPQRIIMETKHDTGYNAIFKLKGFIDHFARNVTAVIIRYSITTSVIELSETLGIRAIPITRMEEIEQSLTIEKDDWNYVYREDFIKNTITFKKILETRIQRELLSQIDTFWSTTNSFHNLKMILESLSKVQNILTANVTFRGALDWLISEYVVHFVISILECISSIYCVPEHQRKSYFSKKYIGGKLSFKEKDHILKKFNTSLKSFEIKNKISFKDMEKLTLQPEYFDNLFDLINRLLSKPEYSVILPRFFDLYHYQSFSNSFSSLEIQSELLLTHDSYEFTIKFARDVIDFLFNGKNPNIYEQLMTGL